jgi:asparagine synthase (glutamine-hydrolysing)
MCDAMAHGGPDDEGFFRDESAGLVFGHRRLSLVDLSANGHQPMTDTQERFWITFNGEIYNYRELKAVLIRSGATFHSASDTEVILQAYRFWGTASFSRFRGMFAFALYDVARGMTYLVRDVNGIKPLYYHISDGQLSFASEVRPLKKAGIAVREDKNWPVQLLAFGHIPEPFTTLENVRSLPKGTYLAWENDHCRYTMASFREQAQPVTIWNAAEAAEAIGKALNNAVRRQLEADAPVGVFLSGGVDSSLLTLLAHRQQQHELRTISIYFDEKAYDERYFQGLVADQIAGEKHKHLVRQDDFNEQFPLIMHAMDMPTTDGINTWFISHYARQDGVKAVLSGIGADELFGGYPSFKRIPYLRFLRKIPPTLLKLASFHPADRYRKIAFLAEPHHLADYLLLRGLFVPTDIACLVGTSIREVEDILFHTTSAISPGGYDAAHAGWFETNLYMQNQLLRDTDVMSMSHGLEVRVPFLDEDFGAVIESIAPRIRFNPQIPKKTLIDSFEDLLPSGIRHRTKMGFTFPLQRWMKEYPQLNDPGAYGGRVAANLLRRFQRDQLHWSKLFALYQIQGHV